MIVETMNVSWVVAVLLMIFFIYFYGRKTVTFKKTLILIIVFLSVFVANKLFKPNVPEGFMKVVATSEEIYTLESAYSDVFTVRVLNFGDGKGDRFLLTAYDMDGKKVELVEATEQNTNVHRGLDYLPSLVKHVEMRLCDFTNVSWYVLIFYRCEERFSYTTYELYIPDNTVIYTGYQ